MVIQFNSFFSVTIIRFAQQTLYGADYTRTRTTYSHSLLDVRRDRITGGSVRSEREIPCRTYPDYASNHGNMLLPILAHSLLGPTQPSGWTHFRERRTGAHR